MLQTVQSGKLIENQSVGLEEFSFNSVIAYHFGYVLNLPPDCPEPPSVTAIIGGSIASVAVIGILLLMLIKLFIYMKDLKEYRKFENEKKKSKWAEVS